jgi:hypothetical protein
VARPPDSPFSRSHQVASMLRCLRIRSLQTGVRRTYQTVASPETSHVKLKTLDKKFVHPFSFEEACPTPGWSLFNHTKDTLGKRRTDPQITENKESVLAPRVLATGHPWSKRTAFRSRLAPKFRIPFDEGPIAGFAPQDNGGVTK